MALHQVAQALLASRGIQPTPENMSRAIAALEANPELAQRVAAGAQRGGSEQGEITEQNPVAAALADQFDVALAKAMNGGGQPPVASEVASVAAQPAPPIVPVDQLALNETVPQAPSPVPVASQGLEALPSQAGQLPSDFDAVAQAAAKQEFGDDWPPPILPAPAGRSAGRALPPPSRAKRKGVTADIERTIDVQEGPMKETVRAGKPAVEFELDGERMWVNEDGIIGNDTTKVIVREQSVLDRVRQFLLRNKSRFAALARIL